MDDREDYIRATMFEIFDNFTWPEDIEAQMEKSFQNKDDLSYAKEHHNEWLLEWTHCYYDI